MALECLFGLLRHAVEASHIAKKTCEFERHVLGVHSTALDGLFEEFACLVELSSLVVDASHCLDTSGNVPVVLSKSGFRQFSELLEVLKSEFHLVQLLVCLSNVEHGSGFIDLGRALCSGTLSDPECFLEESESSLKVLSAEEDSSNVGEASSDLAGVSSEDALVDVESQLQALHGLVRVNHGATAEVKDANGIAAGSNVEVSESEDLQTAKGSLVVDHGEFVFSKTVVAESQVVVDLDVVED